MSGRAASVWEQIDSAALAHVESLGWAVKKLKGGGFDAVPLTPLENLGASSVAASTASDLLRRCLVATEKARAVAARRAGGKTNG